MVMLGEQAMDSNCLGKTLKYSTWVPLDFEQNYSPSLWLGFSSLYAYNAYNSSIYFIGLWGRLNVYID